MQRFARKWAPFVAWLLVVVSVWALLNRHHFNPANDRGSAWMLFAASVVIGVSVVIMLADTAQWSVRRLGVFGLVLFGGLLYGLTASVALWRWTVVSQRDLNWIRALILVSSPMLLVSQVRYISARVGQWRERPRQRTAAERSADAQERTAVATEAIADQGKQGTEQASETPWADGTIVAKQTGGY